MENKRLRVKTKKHVFLSRRAGREGITRDLDVETLAKEGQGLAIREMVLTEMTRPARNGCGEKQDKKTQRDEERREAFIATRSDVPALDNLIIYR